MTSIQEPVNETKLYKPDTELTYREAMLIWTHVILESYELWKDMPEKMRITFGKDLSFMCKQYSKAISEGPLEKVWEAIKKVETQFEILSRNVLPGDHGLAAESKPEIERKSRWKDPV